MRIAVLGTGRMARARAAALAGRPEVGEVVLAGGDAGRTRAAAAGSGARAATVQEALANGPDGVVVASATAQHREHLEACAGLGCAPVLCEKPIALTVRDTHATMDLLRAAGVPVQVGFQRRFDPALRAARDQAASGGLGTLASLRISVHDAQPPPEHFLPTSGGIFRDMHVHDFDLARWLTGREVTTAFAAGAVRGFERFARHGDVDTSVVVLTMDDGMPVVVDGARHHPRGYGVGLELRGSRDAATVGFDGGTWTSFEERFADAFVAETAAFVRLVRDGGDSPCPPHAALEALRVAEACDRSRAEGRPVAV